MNDLLAKVINGIKRGFQRLAIEIGRIGFYEGREFRTFKEFSIAAGASYVVKVVVPINAILLVQGIELDAGSLRIRNLAGGTPSVTFSDTLPIIGKNNMDERPLPLYQPQIVFTGGIGSHDGGFEFDVHRLVAGGATAQQFTVGAVISDDRGVAANTYYVEYENFGNGTATGTFWFIYEERP